MDKGPVVNIRLDDNDIGRKIMFAVNIDKLNYNRISQSNKDKRK